MRKSQRDLITFGEAGTKEIEYTGDLPAVFGPFVTKKVYRFRPGKNPRLVDLRDLPGLTKAAGRRKLREVGEPEAEKKQKPVEKVTIEEVAHGDE